ncbi:teichuronic acid biosynthesis protein TuaE [Mesobacillus foraminis]|uniref:Teichuronic acid biosynthesis protein TuaE n=1 Tax=Mesobacillus foraminis TaxID=279826 RepID=A0A4R2BKY1_9BACI|nr:O-antigen ligase family protein [Mesobacillus foraminis]TCN26674.1 teichuronic acid biosynthesis protein TuaE [Mesobacillus foraminis]
MMASSSRMMQAAGISIFLITGLAAFYSLAEMPKLAVMIAAVWMALGFAVLIKFYIRGESLFRGSMYILVIATFLNQSVLSLNIGFFSMFLYRLLLIAAAGLFLLRIVKERSLPGYWSEVRVKGVLGFLLFWLAYGAVSLLWARSFIEGIKYLFLLGLGVAFVFLAVFTFTKVTRLYLFYAIWMIMTAGLLMLGFMNHFLQIQLPTSTLYGASEYKLGYPTAVFFNQNDFATFLTISVFFYLGAAKNSKNVLLKTASILLALMCVYTIVLTESRASLLAVGGGAALYLFILLPPMLKKLAGAAGVAGVILGGAFVLTKLDEMSANADPQASNLVRLNLLKNTFHYLLDTFGFGVGAGNLPFYLKHDPIYETDSVVEVHNWLAEIIGNFGLPVFLGYVTMYAFLFIGLYKIYQQTKEHKALLEAGMIGLAAFLISSISPSSVSNLYFHWVFLGFVISTLSVLKSREEDHDGQKSAGWKKRDIGPPQYQNEFFY